MSELVRETLNNSLLGVLPEEVLDALAAQGTEISCAGGTLLMERGTVGESAYVVLAGRLRVFRSPNGDDGLPVAVAEVGPGELVGEMALAASGRRTATVVAVRDSHLLEIASDLFDRIVYNHPFAARQIARLIVDRTVQSQEVSTAPLVLTMVVEDLAGSDLPDALRRSIEAIGSEVDVVGPSQLDAVPELVQRAENSGRVLVLTADPSNLQWARVVIRQADVIIPVSQRPGDRSCDLVADELRRRRYPPLIEAVCLGSVAPPAAAMAADVRRHRVPVDGGDLDRPVRLIFGRSKALVLGSGSARGIAHLGVLAALDELRIPIDAVGGTSAGAVIAGMWASGRDASQIREDLIDFLDGVKWLKDLTVPLSSLLTGQQLSDAIENYFGSTLIEDLPVSMFAVSTDLSAGIPVVHDRGPLWRAVRASSSIPGIFPPVRDGDRLLADGAIIDRLPVGTMRALHPRTEVISVDVAAPLSLSVVGHSEDGRVGRRQALTSAIGRRSPTSLGSLIGRIVELTGSTEEAADIVVRPDFASVTSKGRIPFVDAAIAAGYEAAMKSLAADDTTDEPVAAD